MGLEGRGVVSVPWGLEVAGPVPQQPAGRVGQPWGLGWGRAGWAALWAGRGRSPGAPWQAGWFSRHRPWLLVSGPALRGAGVRRTALQA